jgi:predicted PurR-regulated permease PerM
MNQPEATHTHSDINNYAFSIMLILLMISCAICLYFVIMFIYGLIQSVNKVTTYFSEYQNQDKNKSEN